MAPACPKPLTATYFVWRIEPNVEAFLKKVLRDPSLAEFRENVAQLLCSYYNATQGLKKGLGVSPIDCGVADGKGFKARYLVPGRGKRGGLRLGVLALCSKRVVEIAFAEERKEDPSDSEIKAAFTSSRPAR